MNTSFNNLEHPVMLITHNKMRIDEKFLNLIKHISENLRVTSYLMTKYYPP